MRRREEEENKDCVKEPIRPKERTKKDKKEVTCRALIVHPLFSNTKRIQAFTSIEYTRTQPLKLMGIPLSLSLLQFDLFGSRSVGTGSTLWYAEVLLAEYLARSLLKDGEELQKDGRCVLELGCGASPVAGMACAAMGIDTVLTDLKECLARTSRNLTRNAKALVACSCLLGRRLGKISLETLSWGKRELPPPIARLDVCVVLVADCIFNPKLHIILAETLSILLRKGTFALIAHQRRETGEEAFFSEVLPKHELTHEALPVERIVRDLLPSWPRPMQIFFANHNPKDHYKLNKVTKMPKAR
uniref:Uncharacterized protein n=2 Tax=Lotharella oceanica TaxID=641309 RepID=A0A7S2X9G1_9EUKA|mmetsp:Transcript_22175/g.41557  ORF Transcript_22175/g.41557 Transcript_22175/m.41557 type:complete len:302 (+) Transcript_22175:82-987(+)